jgi:hypothetical protein
MASFNVNHLAIIGMSFCGSTVMSYVLGSLPGSATIGESHWIVDRTSDGRHLNCTLCGPACPILTPQLRKRVSSPATSWYDTLGRALGTRHLISSDKDHKLLRRLDPAGNRSELVLYKHPLDHFRSYVRALEGTGLSPAIDWYPTGWSQFYAHRSHIEGKRAFLLFDDFLDEPLLTLRLIAEWADIEFDGSALEYWQHIHHAIGGNFNPFQPRADKRRIIIQNRPRWYSRSHTPLTETVMKSAAMDVFQSLQSDRDRLRP